MIANKINCIVSSIKNHFYFQLLLKCLLVTKHYLLPLQTLLQRLFYYQLCRIPARLPSHIFDFFGINWKRQWPWFLKNNCFVNIIFSILVSYELYLYRTNEKEIYIHCIKQCYEAILSDGSVDSL